MRKKTEVNQYLRQVWAEKYGNPVKSNDEWRKRFLASCSLCLVSGILMCFLPRETSPLIFVMTALGFFGGMVLVGFLICNHDDEFFRYHESVRIHLRMNEEVFILADADWLRITAGQVMMEKATAVRIAHNKLKDPMSGQLGVLVKKVAECDEVWWTLHEFMLVGTLETYFPPSKGGG